MEGSVSGAGEGGGGQRREVEGRGSRSCRDLEAEVNSLDFCFKCSG